MDNWLLVAVVLASAGTAGWFYWQTQKTEQRLTAVAAQLAEQANLVGEMVDEVFAASQHLYHEMDRWQALVDAGIAQPAALFANQRQSTDSLPTIPPIDAPRLSTSALADLPLPALHTVEQDSEEEVEMTLVADYSPHLQALKMAMEGAEPVEIARQTGIGTEELRLLLRFQEAVNTTNP